MSAVTSTEQPKKPKATLSFVVGSKYGPRSSKWNVSVKGRDVYINVDGPMSNKWHVSLHESGQNHLWHDLLGKPTYLKSHDERLPEGAYRVGVFIMIPDYCLHPADLPDHTNDPVAWLTRPEYGGCIEIAVMMLDRRDARENWPGKEAGTRILTGWRWGNEKAVLILERSLAAEHPISKSILEHRRTMVSQFRDHP